VKRLRMHGWSASICWVASGSRCECPPPRRAARLYSVGASATVDVLAEPGAVFTGYGGALSGSTTPQSLLTNGLKTVTAFFARTPVAASAQLFRRNWVPAITKPVPVIGGFMIRTRIVEALFAATLLAVAAQAGTLTLSNGAMNSTVLVGQPGDNVGWDFTWTSTPILDGTNLITPWLLVSNADFVLDSGVNPVGVFTPFITLSSNYTVVGPGSGNGEVNPWSQSFDTTLQTGIGSYSINSFQLVGDLAIGNIVLTYDEYRVSPNDPSFNPITDTIATGLTVSAPTSVLVANASEGTGGTAPEPRPGGLLIAGAIALLAGLFRR